MKNITLLTIATLFASTAALATPVAPSVVSVLDGAISVGTFVSAAPSQYQGQTSSGSLTGSTTVTNSLTAPVISSSIVGSVSSVSTGTGVTYPSFSINNVASSAVAQGVLTTTVSNFAIPVTSITPVSHGHDD